MRDEPPALSSSPEASEPPSARIAPNRRSLARIARIGASGQAAIPGLYAWAITVVPVAWSQGAPALAKVSAVVGGIALVSAALLESAVRVGPTWARAWSVWGFVVTSALVWVLAPSALSAARVDGVRGASGMIAWALFAFASAGPVLPADRNPNVRIVASRSLKPRSALPRGDAIYIGAGAVLALALQAVGWGIAVPERAVLVRLVTLAGGLAVLGAMTTLALARHTSRTRARSRVRLKRALPWLVLLALVTLGAVAFAAVR